MLDALKNAYGEIIESVIRPMKDWILRRSWFVRFLFVIAVGLGAYSYWKPETATRLAQRISFSVHSFFYHENDIPLSATAKKSLGLA
ncbi:MAG TPA: hypothetical protein VKD00_03845, partial [Methyloceanibacter sp.]|nr:hypothetical protein [Methyloceanibacter sp.]